MCVTKIVRPDIHQMLAVFSTRVKEPNETGWQKLAIMIKYLNGTKKKYLTLSSDYLKVCKWYVGASFAIYHDSKSHTGAIMTMEQGATKSVYRKQEPNKRIIKEAELVSADDATV